MKTTNKKYLHLTLALMLIAASLNGCGIVSEVINHEANDQRLLKPGALDAPIAEIYKKYQYKFLDKYKISHDFLMTGGCNYAGPAVGIKDVIPGTNYAIRPATDIFEKDNHTWQTSSKPEKPFNMDQYTRPEWQMGPSGDGSYRTVKGFNAMCFQSWGGTSHTLVVKLYKQDTSIWQQKLAIANPNGKFTEEIIGGNKWLVQTNPIAERRINSTGGAFLHYTTAIGHSDYTLTMQLGANQDSLKNPKAHAQMQSIFKHLIESVKIEPIN